MQISFHVQAACSTDRYTRGMCWGGGLYSPLTRPPRSRVCGGGEYGATLSTRHREQDEVQGGRAVLPVGHIDRLECVHLLKEVFSLDARRLGCDDNDVFVRMGGRRECR